MLSRRTRFMEFIAKHGASILAIIIALSGVVWNFGASHADLLELQRRVSDNTATIKAIQSEATIVAKTGWTVDEHTRDIAELKTAQTQMSLSIAEIRSDVRLIAKWVQDQQQQQQKR